MVREKIIFGPVKTLPGAGRILARRNRLRPRTIHDSNPTTIVIKIKVIRHLFPSSGQQISVIDVTMCLAKLKRGLKPAQEGVYHPPVFRGKQGEQGEQASY